MSASPYPSRGPLHIIATGHVKENEKECGCGPHSFTQLQPPWLHVREKGRNKGVQLFVVGRLCCWRLLDFDFDFFF